MKTCVICEQPGHRYGSTDPYHESVASACINSLKRRVAELEAEVERLREALLAIANSDDGAWDTYGEFAEQTAREALNKPDTK